MACASCDRPVASRIDDCSLWQAVRLAPDAVRRRPVGGAEAAPRSWAELPAEGKGTPPCEPITTWGARRGSGHRWPWSPRWEAAAGRDPSAYRVPLPSGVWLWMVFPEPHTRLPVSGVMPDGVLRDDPPLPRPTTRCGPIRGRSSTPWCACRPSATHGCARSSAI
ncbi:hypothetical protein Sros01_48720 [Streptomyces roseochromogenus]|nr:hypothetical protein Sros01_48720 [Streptomyces roseochromogenus]